MLIKHPGGGGGRARGRTAPAGGGSGGGGTVGSGGGGEDLASSIYSNSQRRQIGLRLASNILDFTFLFLCLPFTPFKTFTFHYIFTFLSMFSSFSLFLIHFLKLFLLPGILRVHSPS